MPSRASVSVLFVMARTRVVATLLGPVGYDLNSVRLAPYLRWLKIDQPPGKAKTFLGPRRSVAAWWDEARRGTFRARDSMRMQSE